MPAEKILSELEYCAESKKLDANVVKVFINLINDGTIYQFADAEPVIGDPSPVD